MSYLRQIMQRLQARSTTPPLPEAADDSGLLEEHLRLYAQNLERCTEAMLQYECAWLEQHLETLELCGVEPGMLASIGGVNRLHRLLEESRRFQTLLERRMADLGLEAARHRAGIIASEHAWELTDPALRRAWGFPVVEAQAPQD
jgi:hypothetical protein